MNCAHLDFTCYTTEAVKKESFVTRTLAIKPAEENNQSLKVNNRKEIFGHFICVFRFYYPPSANDRSKKVFEKQHDNFGIIKIQNVGPQFCIYSNLQESLRHSVNSFKRSTQLSVPSYFSKSK